jgi:hypothetical protein
MQSTIGTCWHMRYIDCDQSAPLNRYGSVYSESSRKQYFGQRLLQAATAAYWSLLREYAACNRRSAHVGICITSIAINLDVSIAMPAYIRSAAESGCFRRRLLPAESRHCLLESTARVCSMQSMTRFCSHMRYMDCDQSAPLNRHGSVYSEYNRKRYFRQRLLQTTTAG